MAVVLAMLLSAAPLGPVEVTPAPVNRVAPAAFQVRVDLLGMLASSWFVPESRARVEAVFSNARGSLSGRSSFDSQGLLLALPGLGPLVLAGEPGSLGIEARALLVTSGVLQLAGLWLGAAALGRGELLPGPGPVLSFSPIAGGHLGLSVRLRGF